MEALGTILGVIIFIVILLYGVSAVGDVFEGGGCLGVIAVAGLIILLASFGL